MKTQNLWSVRIKIYQDMSDAQDLAAHLKFLQLDAYLHEALYIGQLVSLYDTKKELFHNKIISGKNTPLISDVLDVAPEDINDPILNEFLITIVNCLKRKRSNLSQNHHSWSYLEWGTEYSLDHLNGLLKNSPELEVVLEVLSELERLAKQRKPELDAIDLSKFKNGGPFILKQNF